MATWTQTTHGFQASVSTVPVSGTDATLSGTTPFLRFTDTDAGHEDFRLYVDADVFYVDWLSGTGPDVWTNILRITDPTVAVPVLIFNKYTLKLDNLSAVANTKVIQFVVGVEANESFRIEHRGKMTWGPGGAAATDVSLDRVAVGVLQTEMLRVPVDPSVGNDVSRKTYVDAQVALKVAKAGDTMTGFLSLHADPTAALHAATKQYVDSVGSTSKVSKSGDTMTGTLTFDFSVLGIIIQSKIASEANPRYKIDSAGKIEWGPGGAGAVDVGIERDSAGVLRMVSGDVFAIQAGSAGNPSLALVGDLNTGIFSPGADILAVSVGGVERLRIGSSLVTFGVDAIAIGTTPATAGVVRGPNNAGVYFRNAANTGDIAAIFIDTSNNLLLGPSGTDAGRVLPAGGDNLVGIGNASSRFLNLFLSESIRIGTNPATVGVIRLANGGLIAGRNAANSGDITGIEISTADTVIIGTNAVDIRWMKALVALGGGAAPTFGTIGGSGPATAAQNSWMRVMDSAGVAFWVPAWK